MKKVIIVLLSVLILALCSCSPTPPVPEEQKPCYVKVFNKTGKDCGWKIRKTTDPDTDRLTIIKGSEYTIFGVSLEKHCEYVLDYYVINWEQYEVDGDYLKISRRFLASTSIEIDTDTFIHELTIRYNPDDGITYTDNCH